MSTKIDLNSLEALMSGYWLSDLANFSSYLFTTLPNVNWVGFYISDNKSLRLGPFMGKPACLNIPYSKGVCGKAFRTQESLIVDDVHEFDGHISCDPDSRSEMVIPLFLNGKIVGVLDIDSPLISRFSIEDKIVLEKAVKILMDKISQYTDANFGNVTNNQQT